jgi:hypothetical protein
MSLVKFRAFLILMILEAHDVPVTLSPLANPILAAAAAKACCGEEEEEA